MKKLVITAALIICSYVSIAEAEISPEKRKEVEKMLQLTGMEKIVTRTRIRGKTRISLKGQIAERRGGLASAIRTDLHPSAPNHGHPR
jgi:hypothetical protein